MAKNIWQSKTVWIAILQGVAGVVATIYAVDPAVATIGWMAVVKSVLDMVVRVFLTDTAVKL